MNDGFNEESGGRTLLDKEDLEFFGYLVEYLYPSEWLADKQVQRDLDYIILARLQFWRPIQS